jgi:Acetyltransferase (GNAT) family
MSIRIEVVDPLVSAESFGRILRAAWKPPSLNYSTEYLKWQFGFPGPPKSVGALGFVDDRAAGCIAVTPRQVRYGALSFPIYVLSFVAVEPEARGAGLAASLYQALLSSVPRSVPVLAFAESGSVGERLLVREFDRASFRRQSLQACRATGYLGGASGTPPDVRVRTVVVGDHPILAEIFAANTMPTIWNDCEQQQLHHYQNDPRRRSMFILEDGEGSPVGFAMAVMSEVITASGLQELPMLESAYFPNPSAVLVRAAFGFAAELLGASSVVIASNLSYVDKVVVRSAGVRAMPSVFNAYLFCRGSASTAESAISVNLEVI